MTVSTGRISIHTIGEKIVWENAYKDESNLASIVAARKESHQFRFSHLIDQYKIKKERAMSSIVWDGNNLVQKAGDNIEELGHVKYDENSKDFVLWCKDTRNVFGVKEGYVRGGSFPSMKDAKQHAASATSVSLFHHMWLVGLRNRNNDIDADVAQGITDAEKGKPLAVSTFKEEIEKISEKLEKAQQETRTNERKSKKREIWFFLAGLGVGLLGIIV